jgi:fermentation-respiration switch protein FrsA (DUF1100 family)
VIWYLLLTGVALYALVCLAAWLWQDRLVWYPGPAPSSTPAAIGAPFEELELRAKDGATLHAWHVKSATPRGAVLVCHGNAGSIENRLHLAQAFHAMGFDVLLFDYRGYGKSRGTLSEEGTYLDAEAALDHLVARGFGPGRTAVFGESMGGAVAIELATRRSFAALLVEDTFTSLADVGATVYPWLPVRWLSRTKYASIDKLGGLSVPLLVIHSPDDRLVPFAHGERLHADHPGPKAFLRTGGAHGAGGFLESPDWTQAVRRFLEEHVHGP